MSSFAISGDTSHTSIANSTLNDASGAYDSDTDHRGHSGADGSLTDTNGHNVNHIADTSLHHTASSHHVNWHDDRHIANTDGDINGGTYNNLIDDNRGTTNSNVTDTDGNDSKLTDTCLDDAATD